MSELVKKLREGEDILRRGGLFVNASIYRRSADEIEYLAKALLEIAEQVMPDTYLQSDSRCQRAREALK